MRRRQTGLATMEFAVGGAGALLVLFGCIEISRALYVWNTVGEATRRAARVAAVCPLNDPAIREAALFAEAGATRSPILHGLDASMIVIRYSDESGAPAADVGEVAYVTVAINGYQHNVAIPFVGGKITVPPFATTVPAETLGYVPELDARVCLQA